MTEEAMEAECFGGSYKATAYEQGECLDLKTLWHDMVIRYSYCTGKIIMDSGEFLIFFGKSSIEQIN